jgi:hypothetical protein
MRQTKWMRIVLLLLLSSLVSAQTSTTLRIAYQPFQNGFMLWYSNVNHISVYVGSPYTEIKAFPAWMFAWRSLDPVKDRPPVGLHKPILGFGKVWGHFREVRDALGWATAPERAYNATIQWANGVSFISLPDGRFVENVADLKQLYPVTPTPTPSGQPQPYVRLVEVHPLNVQPGQTVTVEWVVENVEKVTLEIYNGTRIVARYEYLDPSDSMPFTIPPDFRGMARFVIYSGNMTGDQMSRLSWVEVEILSEPIILETHAAFQSFEGGYMLWRQDIDIIYVLYHNGSYRTFSSTEYINLPDNPVDAPPPAGRVSPIRGFGRVWSNHSSVQSGLGWGFAAEQGYTARIEIPSDSSLTITFPDGRVARLQLNGWRF